MANKYAAQSEQAQEARRRWQACDRKRRYRTQEEAETDMPRNQKVYQCRYCQHWHRTGGTIAELAGKAKSHA